MSKSTRRSHRGDVVATLVGDRAKEEDDNSDDDDDDDDGADTNTNNKGYCHFNTSGADTAFVINLFGHHVEITQAPASTHLGHGAVVWDSAVVFTQYLNKNPGVVGAELRGKRAIELGSGPGLSGIALMLKGLEVTLTDLEKVTSSLTVDNARRVYAQMTTAGSGAFAHPLLAPHVYPLDWTDWDAFAAIDGAGGASGAAPYDVLVCTDCVFAVPLVEPLVTCLRRLSGPHSVLYVCHEIRDEEANAIFLVELGTYFSFKRVPKKQLDPKFSNDLVQLLVAKPIRTSKKAAAASAASNEAPAQPAPAAGGEAPPVASNVV